MTVKTRRLTGSMVALEDIDQNEEIFRIPTKRAITTESSELAKRIPNVFKDLDEWLAQVLVLMYEYLEGPKSFWKPYFDVFPDSFDTPMFWTVPEIEELQACALRDKIGKEDANVVFRQSILPIVLQNPDVFSVENLGPTPEVELMALAHKMASVMMAYGFDLEKDDERVQFDEYSLISEDETFTKGMVPMADMLNATAESNTRVFHDSTDVLSMKTTRRVRQGDELLNDYGHIPRSDLLRRYGYIHESYEPYDVVEMPLELFTEAVQKKKNYEVANLKARIAWLENNTDLEDGYMITRRTASGSCFPDDLRDLVQTLLAGAEVYKHPKRMSEDYKAELGADIGYVLETAVKRRQAQYGSSIAEDYMTLQAPNVPARKVMAVKVRLGEKEILAEALQESKQMVESTISTPARSHFPHQLTKRQKI